MGSQLFQLQVGEYKRILISTKSYTQVFVIIKENCTFFKYEIVKDLIEEFGNEVDNANLKQYAESFKQYAKCRAGGNVLTCKLPGFL